MANSTSANLKLTVQATGENSGTWGQITNTNLLILEQAIGGYDAVGLNATTGATLTFSNGSLSNGKNQVLKLTGTITSAVNVIIPDSIEKFYIIKDDTTHSGNTLTFKTVSGTGFELDEGKIHAAYSDGTNVTEVALNTLGGTIGTAQIADDAVTNAKIADNAVDSDQIAADAVTNAKVAADAVDTTQLVNDAVTAAKLERKFTISTLDPSGGNDGDIWFKYS